MTTSICIMDYFVAPFSWTRLQAATRNNHVLGLEVCGRSVHHAWAKIDRRGDFARITLFPDGEDGNFRADEMVPRLRSVLDKHQPAYVAIDGWSSIWALTALLWCLQNQKVAILLSDSTAISNERSWWKEILKRRLIRLFSAGLVAGTPQREYLIDLGMPRDRIFRGWDIVDNDYFAKEADDARRNDAILRSKLELPDNYFLAVNRFVSVKNLERLIEAYSNYRKAFGNNAWKFILLGDGPLKPRILEMRRNLDLDNDLVLPGFKQYPELPSYYGLANAFVLASTCETWGLVVNEAMASGLPVLVSERCGCARDLVVNDRNGYSFNPLSVSAITDAMLKISSPQTDLAAMSAASREIIADWSPETWASNLQMAITSTASRKSPKAGWLDRLLIHLLTNR